MGHHIVNRTIIAIGWLFYKLIIGYIANQWCKYSYQYDRKKKWRNSRRAISF